MNYKRFVSNWIKTTGLLASCSFAATVGAQELIKPIRLDVNSKSGAKNNEGVDRYLKGDLKTALKLWDEASLLDFGNAAPWLNGAIANLDLGRFARAARANQEAGLMGDRSSRRYTLGVEIDVARGQLGTARNKIHDGEFQQPEDPYLHMARAKYADAAGEILMAERSRWQAYRLGRTVLVDSKPFTQSSEGAGVGAPSQADLTGKTRQVGPETAFVGNMNVGRQEIGGTAHALQQFLDGEFSVATPYGMFMAGHRHLLGDRPGALALSSIFANTPGARVRLNYSVAGWQKTWGHWTVNTSFREAKVELRRAEGSSFVNNNLQDQWLVEGRYDSGPWTAGGGTSDVYRRSIENPAMEPLGEVFDQGHTRMGHLFLINRMNLTPSIRLLSGGALATIDGTNSVLLTSELGVKLSAGQYLRIGMKPSMNRSGSNLFPEDLSTRSVGKGRGQSTKPLFRPDSKIVDYYAEVPLPLGQNAEFRIRAFQTQFNNGFFASGDSDQVSQMSLTPLRSGRVTGVTTSAELTSGPSFRATVATTFQSSSAFFPTLGHDHQLPSIPNFAAALTFDANVKDWSIALSANYLGPRMTAMTGITKQGTFGTETRQESGIWSLDAHFSRPLGEGSLMLSLDNLTGAELYPGFGTSRSIGLSYQKRF